MTYGQFIVWYSTFCIALGWTIGMFQWGLSEWISYKKARKVWRIER